MHFIHWQSQLASSNPRSHEYVSFLPVIRLTIYQQKNGKCRMFKNVQQFSTNWKTKYKKMKMEKKKFLLRPCDTNQTNWMGNASTEGTVTKQRKKR